MPVETHPRSPDSPAAVLWDLDGTLLDSEKLWDIPLYEFTEKLGGQLSIETRQAMVGTNVLVTMILLYAEVGITEPTEEQLADGAAWIERRMTEVFRQDLPWRPGAEDALATVRAAGLPMALVTSTERVLTEIALDTIGRSLFDVTVCGDEVDGLNKPLPAPYLKACRLLDVDPAACVAIEDSPTGVASAVAAGTTVLVVPCEVPVEPGERRVLRESLVGLTVADLTALLTSPESGLAREAGSSA
jgi:HAD superfamily hydrolase (TIGR01509 family)